MKITVESTDEIAQIPSHWPREARIWKGTDEHGTEILAFIVAVSPQTTDAGVNQLYAETFVERK